MMNSQSKHPIYRVLVAWFLVLVILWAFTKTKFGYQIIFYLVVLTIIILLATNYKAITGLISPVASGEGL
jgi:asparagine N-glycosylation enzyme membrane subunit Stt3